MEPPHGEIRSPQQTGGLTLLNMAQWKSVSLPMKNNDLNHNYVNVYQRVSPLRNGLYILQTIVVLILDGSIDGVMYYIYITCTISINLVIFH